MNAEWPTAPALVLAHSPLTGAAAWGDLPGVLRRLGYDVVVLDVTDDDQPPYAARYVARAALQLRADGTPGRPVVLVGHSGAGYLLPQLGAACRADRRRVHGYVFLDAGIPHGRGATRLSLLHAEDEELAHQLDEHLRDGGRFPEWTDEDLTALVPDLTTRGALLASLRPRALDFFTEPLPYPGDWPDAPCGYVRLTPAYDAVARAAALRGWPVVHPDAAGGHFAACTDPDAVAQALAEVLSRL